MSSQNPERGPHVVVLTNILPPYRIPLYRWVRHEKGLDLELFLMAKTEPNRLWRFRTDESVPVRVLPGRSFYLGRWELPFHVNMQLERELDRAAPNVLVIGGWDQLSYWRALLWARTRGIPVVLQNESGLTSARYTKGPALWVKRQMVRLVSSYVAYGSPPREYLLRLGASTHHIHTGINTVDVDSIAVAVESYRRSPDYTARRSEYGRVVLLYVGQLIPRKGVAVLLRAMAKAQLDGVSLVIVGSGPEEGKLKELATQLGLSRVVFLGFHEPPSLWNIYALADVAVVPSLREVWGLVVNEAVAAGLYVICSDQVGATRDVVRNGWNGEVVPAGDVEALAAALRRVVSEVDALRARRASIMDDARRRLGIGQLAMALHGAVEDALHSGHRPRAAGHGGVSDP